MFVLSWKEKIGFAAGEMGSSMFWQALTYFLPIFYTDVLGIGAVELAVLFIIVRLSDVVIDPIVGYLADRTNTRWGKYRPYLLWGSIPFGIGCFLLFYAPPLPGKYILLYSYLAYFFAMVSYSFVMVPYNSLSSVMTGNIKERDDLNSIRFIAVFIAVLFIQIEFFPLVQMLGGSDKIKGYKLLMILIGVFSTLCCILTFSVSRERIVLGAFVPFFKGLKDLFIMRFFRLTCFLTLILNVYVSLRNGVLAYYFQYYCKNQPLLSSFLLVSSLTILVTLGFCSKLISAFGRKGLFMACLFVITVTQFFFTFVSSHDYWSMFGLQIVCSIASAPIMPILWGMVADASGEYRAETGSESTGMAYSLLLSSIKAGGGIGSAFLFCVLHFFRYQPEQVQSAYTLLGIRLAAGVMPAVLSLLMLIVFFKNHKLMLTS